MNNSGCDGPAGRNPGPWLVRLTQSDGLRFFCFPCAGRAASMYRPWAALLGPSVEVVGIQPPGREGRFVEPPLRRTEALADAAAAAIRPWRDRPFAIFGHSLGAILAFEVTRRLRQDGTEPVHLFLSGRRAPGLPARRSLLSPLDDAAFVDEVQQRFGGIGSEALTDATLLQALLPTLRADVEAAETHQHVPEPPLECPITCFGGTTDAEANAEELQAWKEQTRGSFALCRYTGGHFYLDDRWPELAIAVRTALLRGAAPHHTESTETPALGCRSV